MSITDYHDGSISNDEVTCPWCRHEWGDSWEYADETGTETCEECGKRFTYARDINVVYYMEKAGDK